LSHKGERISRELWRPGGYKEEENQRPQKRQEPHYWTRVKESIARKKLRYFMLSRGARPGGCSRPFGLLGGNAHTDANLEPVSGAELKGGSRGSKRGL